MSRREIGIAASVGSSVLVYGLYVTIVFRMHFEGRFEGPDTTSLIGKTILLLMVAQIAAFVLTQIVVSAVSAKSTEEDRPFQIDERDTLIELRENRAAFIVFILGFISSMAILALGGSPLLVFNLIILSLTLGDATGKLRKLYLYRKGF